MYRIENKTAAIREVQQYLRVLALAGKEIPLVAVDGIYGEATEAAVRAFQKSRRIPTSGKVDLRTFTLLYEEYEGIEETRRLDALPLPEGFPLKEGDTGDAVLLLQVLLSSLREYYPDIGRVPSSSVFSSDTAAAVRSLELVFSERPSGVVTRRLYLRMVSELAARRAAAEEKFLPLA